MLGKSQFDQGMTKHVLGPVIELRRGDVPPDQFNQEVLSKVPSKMGKKILEDPQPLNVAGSLLQAASNMAQERSKWPEEQPEVTQTVHEFCVRLITSTVDTVSAQVRQAGKFSNKQIKCLGRKVATLLVQAPTPELKKPLESLHEELQGALIPGGGGEQPKKKTLRQALTPNERDQLQKQLRGMIPDATPQEFDEALKVLINIRELKHGKRQATPCQEGETSSSDYPYQIYMFYW